ncbi:hypothetical protein Cs7R123_37510 [Catellatospora sp. TT07R-123]|uniref:phosphotransferase n=1 Tax=Catellatospora sp. TT07R-123 TaxID=2733863 RepID=UPI001B057972|nr:phosphotransferase [Catellatospora sp. TT07R-123]GHJ46409.1 hypothetical protein Cs7R123_37510 [Catellatospora sp. TT07R-123]
MSSSYLHELGRLLGGDSSGDVFVGRGAPGAAETYTVVPNAGSPRLLVPHGDRRAASAAISHTSAPRSAKDRLRQRVLSGVFATGVGGLVFRDQVAVRRGGTLAEHLSEVVGTPVRMSVRFGPPRANRKPVLQLIDAQAHTVAYAKVGVNELTTRLIRDEHAALAALSGRDLAPARIPELLHFGTWGDAQLLVMKALPVWGRGAGAQLDPAEGTVAAMRSLARVHGVTTGRFGGGSYAARLAAQVDALGERPAAHLMRAVLAACAGAELSYGCWHGDWNGGNMSIRGGEVLLWDFERFTADVPVGYDVLHFELHEAVTVHGAVPAVAAADVAARAGALLAPFGVDADVAPAVAALYFTEIGSRYLGDRQDGFGTPMGRVDEWIRPALAGLGEDWAALAGQSQVGEENDGD